MHLSSAPGVKYGGREIGSPHPIVPHGISAINFVKDKSINVPWYADSRLSQDDFRYEARARPDCTGLHNDNDARRVGALVREAMDVALSHITVGITTDSIDSNVHEFIISRGAYPSLLLYRRYPKSICTSINEVIHLGVPDMRPIEAGDVVSVMIGCYKYGIHAKICETVVVQGTSHDGNNTELEDDERNERSWRLIKATKKALEEAVAACRPGSNTCDIGRVIESVASKYDYFIVKKWNGHGVGHELQSLPKVKHCRSDETTTTFEPGMMLTIEPILVEGHAAHVMWSNGYTACTVDGGMAAQVGQTVLISEDGAEILSR